MAAALACGVTLPVELEFDAVVAVGVDDLARWADDDGGLLAVHGGLGVQTLALWAVAGAPVGDVCGQCVQAVAVEGLAGVVCCGSFAGAHTGPPGVFQGGRGINTILIAACADGMDMEGRFGM